MSAIHDLLREELFTRTLMDSIPCGVIVLDDKIRVQAMNDILKELLGLTRKQTVGKRIGDAFGCPHSFKGEKECGFLEICKDCQVLKIALAAISDGKKQKVKTKLQLVVKGQVKDLVAPINVIPINSGKKRYVIFIVEDIQKLLSLHLNFWLPLLRAHLFFSFSSPAHRPYL